ncbi:MAG TPA: hypothetical protein VFG69_01705 [Nannocystaceae bacterium]|nr:hypothetical protein [Nannocystaceae bacterium]
MRRIAAVLGLGLGLANAHCDSGPTERVCSDDESLAMFDERIAPLMTGERQSSCNECHLSGVDLGIYAQGDPCTTMQCMVESGIVDLEDPKNSLVLSWVLRAEPASELITADVIQAEHDAVLEWIEYNAECGATVCTPVENPCGAGSAGTCMLPVSNPSSGNKPFEDPGDCRDATLEAAFGALVYSWRGRCFPCHFDSHVGEPLDAPRWIADAECNLGALQTMRNALELGLIDAADPTQSLLLLKPLAESQGGVVHGGHDKFANRDDPAYQDFLAWIERFAECDP